MHEQRLGHERFEQLQKFLRGRRVCFQSSGPSIAELEWHMGQVPKDVVWAAHNVYLPMERILQANGLELDVVFASSLQVIKNYSRQYQQFLERPRDNLLITTEGGIQHFKEHAPGLVEAFDHKLIIANVGDGVRTPTAFDLCAVHNESHIFSFVFFFLILIKAGVRDIACFGLDGGRTGKYADWYFGVFDDYPEAWFHGMSGGYGPEISHLRNHWDKMVLDHCGLRPHEVRIMNYSPESNIDVFPRRNYSELAAFFKD